MPWPNLLEIHVCVRIYIYIHVYMEAIALQYGPIDFLIILPVKGVLTRAHVKALCHGLGSREHP